MEPQEETSGTRAAGFEEPTAKQLGGSPAKTSASLQEKQDATLKESGQGAHHFQLLDKPWQKLEPHLPKAATAIVVALCSFFIAVLLAPNLWFENNTPTGGDVGAHVWAPSHLKSFLPHLNGWSDDWFAGFPAWLHYFPLPGLLITALDVVLPFGVAMKLVIVSGSLLLPIAVWRFLRCGGLKSPIPELSSVASLIFLTDPFHTIYGMNSASALAGMYSMSLGASLALFAAAEAFNVVNGENRRVRLALLVAAAGLSHLLALVLVSILVLGVLLFDGPVKELSSRAKRLIPALSVSTLLASVWIIPFVLATKHTTDMAYEPVRGWQKLIPVFDHTTPPVATTPANQTWQLWAAVAIVPCVLVLLARGRLKGLRPLLFLAVIAAVGYLTAAVPGVWNGRWLPFFYLCLYVFTAAGIGAFTRFVLAVDLRNNPRQRSGLVPITVTLALVVFYPTLARTGTLPPSAPFSNNLGSDAVIASWAKWDFSGYEGKDRWGEYKAIMDTAGSIGASNGCGRAAWEYDKDQENYGTSMAFMLLPYWTNGCIDSLEGLYFEGSETTPFVFQVQSAVSKNGGSQPVRNISYTGYNLDWGIKAARALGASYYLTFDKDYRLDKQDAHASAVTARNRPDLVELNSSGPVTFWAIKDAKPVEALDRELLPTTGPDIKKDWAPMFLEDPTGHFADGSTADLANAALAKNKATQISQVRVKSGSVSFDTSTPGVPVIVHQSWAPQWRVEGAQGPYRVGPNQMLVIPTSNHVELHTEQAPGTTAGEVSFVLGLLALIVLAIFDNKSRLATSAA